MGQLQSITPNYYKIMRQFLKPLVSRLEESAKKNIEESSRPVIYAQEVKDYLICWKQMMSGFKHSQQHFNSLYQRSNYLEIVDEFIEVIDDLFIGLNEKEIDLQTFGKEVNNVAEMAIIELTPSKTPVTA